MIEPQYEQDPGEWGIPPLRLALVPLAIPRTVPRCSFVDLGAIQFMVCRRIVNQEDTCYGCGRPFCEAHRHECRMAPQDSEDVVTRLLCRDCIELSYGGLEQVRAWRLRLNTAR
ncbi:MAG: hypothetical protein H0W02_24150 [Ktedonobacteraceae bacterium]|nr:hypothetical protein [Ktedonobacteraceae bacterium]